MFDRPTLVVTPTRHTTEHVTREIHEHRAPTDESVRLLREMEQKVKDQIIEAVHVGDTTFECVVHTMRHPMDQSVEWLAIFSLNGKKMRASYRQTDRDQFQSISPAEKLRNAIAETIATEILIPALRNLRIS